MSLQRHRGWKFLNESVERMEGEGDGVKRLVVIEGAAEISMEEVK